MKDIKEISAELSKNPEFVEKFNQISKEDPAKQISLTVKLINEFGYDFKEEDLAKYVNQGSKISDDELATVTGGGNTSCYCGLGGGGSGGNWTCVCVLAGAGEDPTGHTCACTFAGFGTAMDD